STIARLIARLYDPQEGSITLDQQSLPSFDLGALRRAVGVVSQQVYLFDGTIRENLLYGRPDASEDDLIEAAKRSEAHDFIAALPQGYDTAIGDRGLQLSGGQRQRLSLARVILKDPPIMILDEATSAVDNETEAAIQRSLKTVSAGRTTVVIAHRLSTIREADRIVVLEAGRLVEEGQHGALLEAGGLYARLWQAQRDLD
ncbi:MAG: ATP-binding cassette domain-containing protein, partial [Myxococcota bacterium]|nr:ATP-binding cassette domain-containing protein [Myxococcota bacterium]